MAEQQTILTAKKQLFTYIAVLLDRSGSMYKIKTDTEGGFNSFLAEQRKVEGRANISLYQFDDVFEPVYENTDIRVAPELVLQPRNSTSLIDAIMESIKRTEEKIAGLRDEPDNVLFVILTDGKENSSREHTRKESFDKISEKRKDKWEFVFIGANQDAIAEGHSYGISADSSLTYGANQQGVNAAYATLSSQTRNFRVTGSAVSFSDEDRMKSLGNK